MEGKERISNDPKPSGQEIKQEGLWHLIVIDLKKRAPTLMEYPEGAKTRKALIRMHSIGRDKKRLITVWWLTRATTWSCCKKYQQMGKTRKRKNICDWLLFYLKTKKGKGTQNITGRRGGSVVASATNPMILQSFISRMVPRDHISYSGLLHTVVRMWWGRRRAGMH